METFQDIMRRADAIIKNLGNRCLSNAWADEENISRVLALLGDQASKDTYSKEIIWNYLTTFLKAELAATLAGMMTVSQWQKHVTAMVQGNVHPELCAPPGGETALNISKTTTFVLEQYRYGDAVKVEPGDICLDLGACFGDTSIWMAEKGASAVHAFEIDPTNFQTLVQNLGKHEGGRRIVAHQKAVSATSGAVYAVTNSFNPGACQISARRPASGDFSEVECVSLDRFCKEAGIVPTFVKMDIEGAELEAINGGAEVFSKLRPKFAICIYHSRDHRWQIPLRLAELCPDYDFYVKKSHPVFETVFFGRPREGSHRSAAVSAP